MSQFEVQNSIFDTKKNCKKKHSNAFKALQNESLKVLNQFLETIYEYKSYFGIFSFSLFVATFLVFPIVVIVLPLGSSRCVFPVVLSRFGVEVLSIPEIRIDASSSWRLKRARALAESHARGLRPQNGKAQRGRHNGETPREAQWQQWGIPGK